MGLFNRKKASYLLAEAVQAENDAEKAIVAAQEARALAAQRRIEAARAEAEENSARLEKEAAEQDLRLAMSEQVKVTTLLRLADQNVTRAKQCLDASEKKFKSVVDDTDTPQTDTSHTDDDDGHVEISNSYPC